MTGNDLYATRSNRGGHRLAPNFAAGSLVDSGSTPASFHPPSESGPSPELPDHPACRQVFDAFADLRRPLRARDLCVALDLPIVAKNTENIRSKLKRLVSRGILTETEPGLLARPCP
jgi:hypothetical protein